MSSDSLQYRLMRGLHQMDFESQQKSEKYFKVFIVVIAIVILSYTQISYLVAWTFQQFSICVFSTLGAMIVCYIAVIPGQAPWWSKPLPAFQANSAREKFKKA